MFEFVRDQLGDTRRQLHWASQMLSAAADALLEKAADDSHSNLAWNSETSCLVGRAGVQLNVPAFSIETVDSSLSLAGKTMDQSVEWLSENVDQKIELRDYDMPDHGVARGEAFTSHDSQLHAITKWFTFAGHALAGNGEIRIWPHHFDMGFWKPAASEGKSVGGGFSLGDQYFDQPYFYINPYGIERPKSLPHLAHGHWTTHWTGAILAGEDLDSASDATAVASQFVADAVKTSLALLA